MGSSKVCMWTGNLSRSPAAGSEQRPGPLGSPFPFLALPQTPPLRTPPWWGRAWQWTAVCVCVCVRLMSISCFIEEAAFACTDRSDFHCEKKKAEKKKSVNSHESVWETALIVSGKDNSVSNTLGSVFKCTYVLIKFKEVIHFFFPTITKSKKCHKVLLNLLAFFLK